MNVIFGDEDKRLMARHGTIGSFSGEAEDWTAYTESLEHYFIANDITEPPKKAILLSVCGTPTYKLIRPNKAR